MPTFMIPIGAAMALFGAVIMICALIDASPPSLLWERKTTLRPGWGVELYGKHYQNNGTAPIEIIPMSNKQVAYVLTKEGSVICVTDLPTIEVKP